MELVKKQVILAAFGLLILAILALLHFTSQEISSAIIEREKFDQLNDAVRLISEHYNALSDQILDTWFFVRNNVDNSSFYDRYRYLLATSERLRDILEPIRRQKAEKLGQKIYQRLTFLQNPIDCEAAKFSICKLEQCPGGFGCQLHHAAFCLMISYAMGRMLVLESKPWRYAPGRGFEGLFHPIGNTEKCRAFLERHEPEDWNGRFSMSSLGENNQTNATILTIPWLPVLFRTINVMPDIFPMAIPQDLANEMKSFHRQPFIWWAGLFLRYILRPRLATCQSLTNAIEKGFNITMANISQIKPLVGIHVRRTDKVGTEALYHWFDEYMKWAIEYFDQLEYKLGHEVVRSVYIATDEPSISEEARKNYPGYKFYHNPDIALSASQKQRYSGNALGGILIDLTWLVRSDFIICTFSSNICRLAFALLQTLHGDASDRFRSLDYMYFYWGQRNAEFEVVLPHNATNSEEISLNVGDHLKTAFNTTAFHLKGNLYNGYFRGFTNPVTQNEYIFPAYKLHEVIYATPMANYSHVNYKNDLLTLKKDSCLLI